MKQATAIVLFSLGGPSDLESVRPFLFNLFNDPAIIGLPKWPRWLLAKFISWRRAPKAREIYRKLGGKSPLLANTIAQALALSRALDDADAFKVFVAMRYWNPMSAATVRAVKEINPAKVILLPMYPQFSGTTTGSSYKAWMEEAGRQGLHCPQHLVCCFPDEPGFIGAVSALVREGIAAAAKTAPGARPLVIFSAHGLPKRVVERGDPYQSQVELGAGAIAARLGLDQGDWIIAYQSRVGPLEWIGPSTDETIAQGAKAGRAIVLVPIAFVSEHSETLVELDIEYRELAERMSAPAYIRVPTVATHPDFIGGLAALVRGAALSSKDIAPGASQSACRNRSGCACAGRTEGTSGP